MGNCIYCKKPAGLFKKYHDECKKYHATGANQITKEIVTAAEFGGSMQDLETGLGDIARAHFVSRSEIRLLAAQGWEGAVDKALDDDLLSEEEESNLTAITDALHLTQDELDNHGAFTRVAQAGVLRDIVAGKISTRCAISGTLPFNFQKGESIIWVFNSVEYHELRTRTQFVGSSSGVSVRVMKGVYYRVGAFKGEPIKRQQMTLVDKGMLAVTNKHIYFGGVAKSLRIRLDKIIAIQPFSDGISVQRDAATAVPQYFITGSGWFIYNLVSNLSQA